MLLTLTMAAPALAQQALSIATGGTGGVYYPLGGGLAELINRQLDGYTATAEVTGASVENLGLIARGDADLAICLADTVQQAYAGSGRFEGQKLGMVRGLATLYANLVQVATLADSDIGTLADLRGKRVSVGAPGSGTEVHARTVLAAAGLSLEDIDAQRLNFNETADALANGDIDAGFWSVGAPNAAILNLATVRPIRMLNLTPVELQAALAAEPVFAAARLPAGTYPGVDEDVTLVGVPNVLVVSADMPDDLAQAITRLLFENVAALEAIHPAAAEIGVAFTLASTPVPLHPGAVRYFEQTGASVPDRLKP